MVNIYDFEEVKRKVSCVEYLRSKGIEVNSAGRCAAVWRGGKGLNVHVERDKWFDFKTEQGGSVLDLCAAVENVGDLTDAARILGDRFHLEPKRRTRKAPPLVSRSQMLLNAGFALETTYPYTDADGKPVYFVDRYRWPNPFTDPPEDFKRKEFVQRTPEHEGLDPETPHLLYRLPEVVAAKEVFVVEGEKDVETLRAWGFVATTNSGGASKGGSRKWPMELNGCFAGKDVVIISDNDDKGAEHAQNLVAMLRPVAASVRSLVVSALPKGDVTDWKEKEGGTPERLRELVAALPAPVRRDAESKAAAAALAEAKLANEYPFSNYRTDTREGTSGRRKTIEVPRPINELVAEVHTRFLDFPKRIGDYTLFDHDRDTDRIEVLDNRDALFAWIGQKSKRIVNWKKLDGAVSKGELFSGLIKSAKRYEKTSAVPDYPMRPDVYYTFRDRLRPTPGHSAFARLLSFFAPDGDASAAMLAAFFAAPMFFRPGIQRPCWIIDSHEARGVGKTTLVNRVADLYGCRPISTNRNELERNQQEFLKRIVSVSGRDSRIVLLDNLKGFFDDPQWAEFVTTPAFSGRAPYGHGEESRLNDLTFVITSNSANIGSDVASRSFMVFLKRPPRNPLWAKTAIGFIRDHRLDVLGDIHDIMSTSAAPESLRTYTRVPDFEREVVFPFCGSVERFDATMAAMMAERENANVDSERARNITDEVRDGLRRAMQGFDPDTGIAFVRSAALALWLRPLKVDVQDVWNMINTKQIECFHREVKAFPKDHNHNLHGRGFLYIGPNAIPPDPPDVPIFRMSGDKSVVLAGTVPSVRLMRQLAAEGWFSRAAAVVEVDSDDDGPSPAAQPAEIEDAELLPM